MIYSVSQHLENLRFEIDRLGWHGIPFWLSKFYHRKIPTLDNAVSIWEFEADAVIILDSCRGEWLQQVESEYDFFDDVDIYTSVGGHSEEWLNNTFAQHSELVQQTGYITGNIHGEMYKNENFSFFYDANLDSDLEFDIVPPAHMITNRAVALAREFDWETLIVHYMQPHKPFFKKAEIRTEPVRTLPYDGFDIYRAVFRGDITWEDIEQAYIENLHYVLDEVELLLDNLDAEKVLITSDHGHALGEKFLYDHEPGVRHPAVRKVPATFTSATDNKTISPVVPDLELSHKYDREQRLSDLGYI